MKKTLGVCILVLTLLFSLPTQASFCAVDRPEVQAYIDELVEKYDFDRELLDKLFCTVTVNEEVVGKLIKPAEAKPWYLYKQLVITPEKVDKGIAYWNTHRKTLELAEKLYGVPADIIVAIIGVETKYGEKKGQYPVFNTLVNLAFNNNRRADFFKSELTQYLLLARENNFKPLLLQGSYAGALGLPQFMPSSYRHYAVDFYHKGKADLFNDDADAIGSIGNYLKKHGWKTGEEVAVLATFNGEDDPFLHRKNFKPFLTEVDLEKFGIVPTRPLHNHKTSLIRLEMENGYEYWLGLQNFYVISTYNKSELYVMAVYTLSNLIKEKRQQAPTTINIAPKDNTPSLPPNEVTQPSS